MYLLIYSLIYLSISMFLFIYVFVYVFIAYRIHTAFSTSLRHDLPFSQSHYSFEVWSNGALDPWSGMGVYPEHSKGPAGPMVQKINEDRHCVLEMGDAHLLIMFYREILGKVAE